MALAHEAKAVNDVKRQHRFTVVIGNPPYSKLSGNWNEWIDSLLHGRGSDAAAAPDYYQVDGAGLGERTVWIQDDYIKFTRLSQWQIDRSGTGIHGYISNNGILTIQHFAECVNSFMSHSHACILSICMAA